MLLPRVQPLEEEKKKHQNEADLAGRVLGWDFGPDDAYMALVRAPGRCLADLESSMWCSAPGGAERAP